MKHTTVSIACLDGLRNVGGYVRDDVPGLAITPNSDQASLVEDEVIRGGFRITHIESGRAFGRLAINLERAERALYELGQHGADWSQTHEHLRKDPAVKAAWKAARVFLVPDTPVDPGLWFCDEAEA